jgi:uncharacterized protein (DUF1697 family)
MKTITYIALLRGINVGGNKLIKMKELSTVLSSAGLHNVRTFIASGNVIFESTTTDRIKLARMIEKQLTKAFGHDVAVMVRTIDELEAVVKLAPFRNVKNKKEAMLFTVFLASQPKRLPKLPLRSETERFNVIAIIHGVAFIVARRKKTGWFGFPNNFIEKQLAVTATTRNWSTVERIVAFAKAVAK